MSLEVKAAAPAPGQESQNTSCCNGAICHWLGCGCNKTGDKGVTAIQNQRTCTDMLWLVLYVLSWAGVLALMGNAITNGGGKNSILGLLGGVDMGNGIACGTGVNEKLGCSAFPALSVEGLRPAMMCVECPATGVTNCSATVSDPRMITAYESTLFLGRFCLPATPSATVPKPAAFDDSAASAMASRAVGDLLTTANVIAVAAACACVIALIYLKLLQCCAGVLVYASLTLILLGGALAAASCFKYAAIQTTVRYVAGEGGGSTRVRHSLALRPWHSHIWFYIVPFNRVHPPRRPCKALATSLPSARVCTFAPSSLCATASPSRCK